MATLFRGDYELPHQSQATGRDLMAEKIGRHFGQNILVYRTAGGDWGNYSIFVYGPIVASSWAAFRSLEEFHAWLDAYGITMERDPKLNERRCYAYLPSSYTAMQPLQAREMAAA